MLGAQVIGSTLALIPPAEDRRSGFPTDVAYTHPSDGRLVFGGRTSFSQLSPSDAKDILYRRMVRIFPDLSGIEIDHSWEGKVGYTRDHLPHVGRRGSVTYAVGYCGAGVALATLFGAQAARWIAEGEPPVFSRLRFPVIPLYSGKPWFLPLVGPYYQARDWFS